MHLRKVSLFIQLVKGNEVRSLVAVWVEPEDTVLSGESQAQKVAGRVSLQRVEPSKLISEKLRGQPWVAQSG